MPNSVVPPDTPGLLAGSRYTLRQLVRLVAAYWSSDQKLKARSLTLGLVLLTLAQVVLEVWTSYWNRALFDALDDRSLSRFLMQIGTFVVIFVLTMTVTAVHLYVKRKLQLGWRNWLTEQLVERWMAHGHHYRLLYTPGEHDNPDGRIAEDIRIATEAATELGHTLLYSLLIFGVFVNILWTVSGSASVPGTSISVPGYMVALAFVYAGIGTVLGTFFGRPLITATNRMQTAEADFRFGLAHSRENSEAIALLHGEAIERRHSVRLFDAVRSGWNRQSLAFMGIVAFSSGYGTLLPVFPILMAAPQYIAGAMTLGVLMQGAQAFQKLTSALSWPVNSLGDIAKCRASADRVLSLYLDLKELEAQADVADEHRIAIRRMQAPTLVIRDLCIANPDGKVLLDGFNAEFQLGERVLIAGGSAVTVALFKVLAGLWPWGRGEVELPVDGRMLFLPQRPFMPSGTLREVLSYPQAPDKFAAHKIHHALECAGVAWLAPRLDESDVWDRLLPLRTQQRLAFARLFLHEPGWIFLEEATDALDPDGEGALMEALHAKLPNSTIVTISFHPGLERYHTRKLVLNRIDEEISSA